MTTPVYIVAGQSNAYSLNGGNGGADLAQTFARLTGSGKVQVAAVQSPGAPLTWGRADADWYHQNELFETLVATIEAALSDPDAYLASIVWIQGEGDTWSFARATEYAARLTALVDSLQARLLPLGAQTEDFRFTVLTLSDDCPAKTRQSNWDTIRQQQLSLDHPRIDVIDVDTVPGQSSQSLFQPDGLHYAATANQPVLSALMDRTPILLLGGKAADRLSGLSGDDTLRGGEGNDHLSGQAGDDYVRGWTGNDSLVGGGGNDTLTGDLGADRLHGGAGADSFVFCNSRDSGTSAMTWDVISDFTSGSDKLVLTAMDADTNTRWNQDFHYLGSAAFDGVAGALRVVRVAGGCLVQLDVNGDRLADAMILLAQTATVTVQDFML